MSRAGWTASSPFRVRTSPQEVLHFKVALLLLPRPSRIEKEPAPHTSWGVFYVFFGRLRVLLRFHRFSYQENPKPETLSPNPKRP